MVQVDVWITGIYFLFRGESVILQFVRLGKEI